MKTVKSPVQLLKQKIKELGFYPKKFLGQNFLINPLVIQKTVSAVATLNPELIIEVGPGLGALTKPLIELKCDIYVIEIDTELCAYWKNNNVNILEGDILKLPWQSKVKSNCVLVGNLSYQIASRLVIDCCPPVKGLNSMVLMFQKEVAQRILAAPSTKDYGLLSVLAQCFWNSYVLIEATTSDFYPRPQVAGQVLVFDKKIHNIKNPKAFLKFVKLCFSQKRKILLNLLKQVEEKQNIINIFNKINLSLMVRAEVLTPQQFIILFDEISNIKK